MFSTKPILVSIICACVLEGGARSPWAAETNESPVIEPGSGKILLNLVNHVQGLKSFSVDVQLMMIMEAEGFRQETTTTYGFAIQRPDKVALRHKRGMPTMSIVSDGKKKWVYLPIQNRYAEDEAPKRVEDVVGQENTALILAEWGMFLLDSLIAADAHARIMEGVQRVELAGAEDVDGMKCDRLKFRQKDFDWDIWVTQGEKPLPVRVEGRMPQSYGTMGDQVASIKGMKGMFVTRFQNWSVATNLADETFAFAPPAGAQMMDAPAVEEEAAKPYPLLGKPAPVFALPKLEGGEGRIIEYKGKNVVVLHFWSSWDGASRRTLPAVVALAAEYQDKGVALLTVNQTEKPEAVRDFLKGLDLVARDAPLACPVLLDLEGQVGDLYEIDNMPMTVLVGKDGTIQSVHLAAGPDFAKKLKADLEGIAAGRNPAPPEKRKP